MEKVSGQAQITNDAQNTFIPRQSCTRAGALSQVIETPQTRNQSGKHPK
jgi:hypothetical protein